jgi:hypothetical protein
MVMTYRYMVSLCSARLDKIKQYDSIYGNDTDVATFDANLDHVSHLRVYQPGDIPSRQQ